MEFVKIDFEQKESISKVLEVYNCLAASKVAASFGLVVNKKKLIQITGKVMHVNK